MRNRRKTIQSLQRLAERPGTPEEGATARRLLDRMLGSNQLAPFSEAETVWLHDPPLTEPDWDALWRKTVRTAMDEEISRISRVVPQVTEEFLTEFHRRYNRKPPGK